jgi:trans-aconitate 2-methyltransferase
MLWRRWPDAEITGLDSSAEMIHRAQSDYPQIRWLLADIRSFSPGRTWDLVYSSATLQWMDGHDTLLPHLLAWVNPNGALAIQVPANNESPLHRAYQEVAARSRWRDRTLEASQLLNYRSAAYYYDLLARRVVKVDLWETTYYHVLTSHQGLIEWYRGTAMRPALARLESDAERYDFEQEVLDHCRSQYEVRADGQILFPFKRIFLVVYRQSKLDR